MKRLQLAEPLCNIKFSQFDQIEFNFRNLHISDFTPKKPFPSDECCQSLACRSCSPNWILSRLQRKHRRKSITIRVDSSNSSEKFILIKSFFDSLPRISRLPEIIIPEWSRKDAETIFLLQTDPVSKPSTLFDFSGNLHFQIDAIYCNGCCIAIMQTIDESVFWTAGVRHFTSDKDMIAIAIAQMLRDFTIVRKLLKTHNCTGTQVVSVLFIPSLNIEDVMTYLNCLPAATREDIKDLKIGVVSRGLSISRSIYRVNVEGVTIQLQRELFSSFLGNCESGEKWSQEYQHLTSSFIVTKEISYKRRTFSEKPAQIIEPMAAVISIWRPPPTPVERETHEEMIRRLTPNQKLAMKGLEDIIHEEKKGEFLLTYSRKNRSDLGLLPTLMTNDWFLPTDIKSCEIGVPHDMMPDENPHLEKGRLQRLHSDESIRIRNEIIQQLGIDENKVIVEPPQLAETNTGIEIKTKFVVTINGKNEDLPEQVEVNTQKGRKVVNLRKISAAKKSQIPVFKLKFDDLDSKGDREFLSVETKTLMRGGLPYKKPCFPWIRVGLKVIDRYEDNQWLSKDGSPGEWAVGYHGSTKEGNVEIASSREILPGPRQAFRSYTDTNKLSDNLDKPCGPGSYFADDIEISAEQYAAAINGRICVFQARLCPSKVRIPSGQRSYRIVNEVKYARPYGICVQMPQPPSPSCLDFVCCHSIGANYQA